jgi:hypothetical protein
MTKFADQLYDDLMREHGPALAATRPPAPSRRHIASRPALLAVGAGGLAVAATAGALAASGGTPAYALTSNRDGTVTLAVYQASGIAQANTKLRQLGDQVVLVPVRPGCPAISSLPKPAVLPKVKEIGVRTSRSKDGSITVNVTGIPAGDILVIAEEITGNGTERAASLTVPPAPNCVTIPAAPGGSGPSVVHNGASAKRVVHGGGSGQHVAHTSGSAAKLPPSIQALSIKAPGIPRWECRVLLLAVICPVTVMKPTRVLADAGCCR